MQTGKKILLVECLIGTEKKEEKYILSEYMVFGKSKSKKFWCTWHLNGNM